MDLVDWFSGQDFQRKLKNSKGTELFNIVNIQSKVISLFSVVI